MKNQYSLENSALIIVDAQRGFMPAKEGERLNLPGFGELAVENGEKIVEKLNQLIEYFHQKALIVTSQDQHPENTAHFSDQPNFVNSWPKHCVANTPGAEFHPELLVAKHPELTTNFIKGTEECSAPEFDDSYSAALARLPEEKTLLPDWLKQQNITKVFVTGLALGDGNKKQLCADSTASDLNDLGFDVTLVTDAAEAVIKEEKAICFKNLEKKGIKLATTNQIIN